MARAALEASFLVRSRLYSSTTVYRTQGSGGGTLGEDLKVALQGFANKGRGSKAGAGSFKPKFIVAVVSSYGKDLTEKVLAKAVKEASVGCPIVGCQAKGIRDIRRHRTRGGGFAQPRVTCWSMPVSVDAFAFYQKHTSVPDMERWSGKSMKELILDKDKRPFTFTFGSPEFEIQELVQRNANLFNSSVGAVPRGPVQDLYFVANATNNGGGGEGVRKGRGGRTHVVSEDGIVGLGLSGNLRDGSWLNFARRVLSSHWWHDVNGCPKTAQGLFVPNKEVVGKARDVSSRHVHKYAISDFAHGIPMFPINGACLYPATEMQLRIFEPRYKAMVKQCVENKEVFGFIPKDDKNNKFVDTIGTIAYVKEIIDMSPDGESTIVIKGLRRFKFKKGCSLRTQPGSFGLNYADIQFFDDTSDDSDDETFATTEGFGTELQLLAAKAQRFLGGDQHLMTSAHDMSFLLADALPAPQQLKMRWLKSMSTADRLNETIEFLSNYKR